MNYFGEKLRAKLRDRQDQQLFRSRRVLESAQGTEVVFEGKKYLSFCSNDYLGLANHSGVINSFKKALDKYGLGSGASHLITGHSTPHHALEEELADFTGRSKALIFSSGYMANIGIITTLLGKQDVILEDRLNHVSLIEGGIFSGANFKRYPHLNTNRLSDLLDKYETKERVLVASDGVFSMDGDQAPLETLVKTVKGQNKILMIDDAHGFGCLGKSGGGLVQFHQEQGHQIDEHNLQILVGTFGKAFGTSGAFVVGSNDLIESLIQFCRPYVYTTAMAPAMAEATRVSLNIIKTETWRREYLASLIKRFKKACAEFGFSLIESDTPIQALVIGEVEKTLVASKFLENKGIIVSAIRPPTVPIGKSRLRITFSAEHTEDQFLHLLNSLELLANLK